MNHSRLDMVTMFAAVLVAAALIAMTPGVEAARWRREVVVVRDHTSGSRWGPIIAAEVDALNAALPPSAPRFVYRNARAIPCAEIDRGKRAISVCSIDRFARPAATSTTRRNETMREALIVLRDDQIRLGQNRVCHELMHATTAIPDAYQTEPESCVRGSRATFGAWDIALLASEYGTGR
jgi:hypothetical protein